MTLPLIIFDSGIGGFSILREFLTDGPSEIIYIADQGFFPYGNKNSRDITDRVIKVFDWARPFNPSLFLLACNTATSSSIDDLREVADIPIVGVEPVIKPLSYHSRSALLATPLTAGSDSIKRLLRKWGGRGIDIVPVEELASSIENMDDDVIDSILDEISNKIGLVDAIGLSCTHFSLVREKFEHKFQTSKVIDPSRVVASRVRSLIPHGFSPEISFYTTGEVIILDKQIDTYLNIEFDSKKIDI